MQATARNVLDAFCKEYKKDKKRLKGQDILRLVAYATNVGQYIGFKQAIDALANIGKEAEKHEGQSTEPIEEMP